MKPLSAITAPIIARLHADRAAINDRTTAELQRLDQQNRETIKRLTSGDGRAQPQGKETA